MKDICKRLLLCIGILLTILITIAYMFPLGIILSIVSIITIFLMWIITGEYSEDFSLLVVGILFLPAIFAVIWHNTNYTLSYKQFKQYINSHIEL